MIVPRHFHIAPLILVLQDVVHALESSSFQLVDLVVEDLEAGDADDRHIIWRMRNLHAKGEGSNENLREFGTRDKADIAWIVCLLACQPPEDAQNHTHESTHHLSFLKNTRHFLVLTRQLQLVLSKLSVQGEYICTYY